jgi:hypothetical protein
LVNDKDESGADQVGSVAEEAAKLFGALSGWAREQGEGVGHGLGQGVGHGVGHGVGQGVAGAAQGISEFAHNVNEHFATGGEDCLYCPICRGVHFVRSTSPEVRAHLLTAASSLLQAAAGLMATHVPSDRRTPSVEHIDLDSSADSGPEWDDTGEWPDDAPADGPFSDSADPGAPAAPAAPPASGPEDGGPRA